MPRHASAISLEHILLALLDEKPMHGYELYQELNELQGISQIWNIKQALLYSLLDKLEARGFLASQTAPGESYPPRKYFHLTPMGKTSLEDWMVRPTRRPRDMRQEFLAKAIVAHRYGGDTLQTLLHNQKRIAQRWLTELHDDPPPLDDAHLDEWLVYSFRLQRANSVSIWLAHLEQDLAGVVGAADEDKDAK